MKLKQGSYNRKARTFSVFPPNVEYTDELVRPIYVSALAGKPMNTGYLVAAAELVADESAAKLLRLFEFYGIDAESKDAGLHLACALASAHVPGMKIKLMKPPGTIRINKTERDKELLMDRVDDLKATGAASSDADAIRLLVTGNWPTFRNKHVPTLQQRLKEMRTKTRRRKKAEADRTASIYAEVAKIKSRQGSR